MASFLRGFGALGVKVNPLITLRTNSKLKALQAHCIPRKYLSLTSAAMGKHINIEVKDGVAVMKLDSPDSKVNTLTKEVFAECEQAIKQVASDSSINSAVLISGKTGCFIAGADIGMIETCETAKEAEEMSRGGQELLQTLEDSKKPFVAAIMGTCLGGGLEVALSCHYRIAVNDKKTVLSTPEVMLGLLPGAGGTQRLPKLLSLPNALDMMLTGKNIPPPKAKKMGLVHSVIDEIGPGLKPGPERTLEYLEEIAIDTAKSLANGSLKPSPRKKNMMDKIMDKLLQYEFGRNYVLKQARNQVMKLSRGLYPAPLRILDIAKTTLEKGSKAGYLQEAQYFGELAMTKECSALKGLYHGQTLCKKNKYGTPKKPVETLGILGAGLMGAGIAQVSVDKNIPVVMKDISLEGLAKGQQQIQKGLDTQVKRRKITSFKRDQIMSMVDATIDYENFKKCDMVVEAVFEEINVKHKVVKEIEQHIPEHCILATNTSALPIKLIAKASKRPQNVVGMHYFSPVDKMQLLEVISSDKTSPETAAAAVDVGLRQGKVVISVKDTPGFYVNRVVTYVLVELGMLLQEGMDPKEIDKAAQSLGFHTGIATVVDEVGIDVATHMLEFMVKSVDNVRNTGLWSDFVANGLLGRKSGKGIFVYSGGKSKTREVNPEAMELFKKYHIPPKQPLTNELAADRLLALFVNEAVRCLELGIIQSAAEGDIGAVFGIGFPPCLGGPFRYVDNYGADYVVDKMRALESVYGSSFTPCQLLLDHANDPNKKFFSN
ncbi:trifunctional enzyme subunit alpha, mitochondrial-like [Tubulanus polymorphus]|uniref:trifunctional enzyme subunit alpha, mitochondrial-like n=1 Tax=Tubulanus polymorphus TaxID=672921 RepID=UPI003DA36DC1